MSTIKSRLYTFANEHPQFGKPAKHFLRRYLGRYFPASALNVDRAEWQFYLDYLHEGMVVFDVGANLGEFTRFFSHFVNNDGRVHAFEASQATFECLKATCLLKEHENIALNHLAVADQEKTLQFHVYPPEYWGMNTLADRSLKHYGLDAIPTAIEEVEATTIDAYCQQKNITQIDLLKIDVEGAEYQVLRGAQRMLSQKKIRCGIFEFGQTTYDMGNDPNAIESYLNQNGYRVTNLIRGNPKFPKDRNGLGQFSMHLFAPIK